MNATDQKKLTDAGWVIIRERDLHPIGSGADKKTGYEIWAKTRVQPEWHKYSATLTYPSKAARRRVMKILLDNSKIVED